MSTRKIIESYGAYGYAVEPVPKVQWETGTNDFVFIPTADGKRPCPQNKTKIFCQDRAFPDVGTTNPQVVNMDESGRWCLPGGARPLDNETISINQSLVGEANPKTKVRPIIPNPIFDQEAWSPMPSVTFPQINDQRSQEYLQNGYMEVGFPGSQPTRHLSNPWIAPPYLQNQYSVFQPHQIEEAFVPERISMDHVEDENAVMYHTPCEKKTACQWSNTVPYSKVTNPMMDTACGYNTENLKYNLPVNYNSSACQRRSELESYNENLFSIPLQPDVYQRSQINQTNTNMSNLGISFTEPHYPMGCQMEKDRQIYTDYDPSQVQEREMASNYGYNTFTDRQNIYDPRFYGAGTSYRQYIDPMTGQPRFYYDDVEAHTQYNYITKNNIDFAPFGQQSGPYQETPLSNMDVRQMANEQYTQSVLTQRNELQQRLMAKNSNREWQRRIAPIITNRTARAMGGTQSSKSYAGPRGG